MMASLAGVVVIDSTVFVRLALHVDTLPALPPGAPDIPPLPALVVDLIVPLLITMGYVLLLQERLMAHIGRLSTTDPLTGALNRRGLMTEMEIELRRVHRYGTPMSVILFDLDHFKSVNDTYGHAVGDEVLTSFVAQARLCVRPTDRVARWGGEEFLVLLTSTNVDGAVVVAERLRQSIAVGPMRPGMVPMTVSAGVAGLTADQPQMTLEQLLAEADQRLYDAKTRRNCVVATGYSSS
jgi:diguanylate cyclase (GGDEF)-like protein